MLYEMLVGESPFYFDGVPETELYRSIGEDDYPPIQDPKVSAEAKDLIHKLLEKNPNDRIGSLAMGEPEVLFHPWFQSVDAQALRNKSVKAPWMPRVKDPFDTSNFDDWDDVVDIAQ